MSAQLTILSSGISQELDLNLMKLARFMGMEPALTPLESIAGQLGSSTEDSQNTTALVAHSTSFKALLEMLDLRDEPEAFLERFDAAYIYGFTDPDDQQSVVGLSNGGLTGSSPISATKVDYRFADDDTCRQFAGLSFTIAANLESRAFDTTASRGSFTTLISVARRPFLVVSRRGKCETFLCSSAEITDLDANAGPDDPSPKELPRLIPFLLFIKHVFGAQSWENPYRHATIVIDDPLLRPKYGFLSHRELLANMSEHGLASTIAFIPWNRRRSKIEVTDLFKQHSDRLSICVHGCDHTGAEFGTLDASALRRKAFTALERTKEHEALTGLHAEPIMVFPQGIFSKASLKALSDANFLAAVNTTLFPVDSAEGDLKLKDILDIAVNSAGLPLFRRHYPVTVLPFALDLFLGKPALIAAHHDTFKNGYSEICDFADKLRTRDPKVMWVPLERALIETGRYQRVDNDRVNVNFQTDWFRVQNPYGEAAPFKVSKRVGLGRAVGQVLADGRDTPYQITDGILTTDLSLGPGAHCDLQVMLDNASARVEAADNYDPKVATRRYLSEFRDNYLARSGTLMAFSKRAVRLLSH